MENNPVVGITLTGQLIIKEDFYKLGSFIYKFSILFTDFSNLFTKIPFPAKKDGKPSFSCFHYFSLFINSLKRSLESFSSKLLKIR